MKPLCQIMNQAQIGECMEQLIERRATTRTGESRMSPTQIVNRLDYIISHATVGHNFARIIVCGATTASTPAPERLPYGEYKSRFILAGTTINKWAKANGLNNVFTYDALKGGRSGPAATRIVRAANRFIANNQPLSATA